ncbi:hypothetical protein BCR43DRAFT_563362 [Syncephalastrum racemosum]|uniref:Pentacotripeptide-repeat region of PRORP domain-containing protein n=1 Tax=Syncephalastrum racemosum TaxID=13706 RepID=A0A1X2HHV8_SYNRA|nr:hypothetical protein BCR43DRAFT_563362 [Syncephalastrum racemosum]
MSVPFRSLLVKTAAARPTSACVCVQSAGRRMASSSAKKTWDPTAVRPPKAQRQRQWTTEAFTPQERTPVRAERKLAGAGAGAEAETETAKEAADATELPKQRTRTKWVYVTDEKLSPRLRPLYVMPIDSHVAAIHLKAIIKETGSLEAGIKYLEALPVKLQSVAAWNTIIAHHAEAGRAKEAQATFTKMRKRGFRPNNYTFTNLLISLSRSDTPAAVERAEVWMRRLSGEYNLYPNEHNLAALLTVYEKHDMPLDEMLQTMHSFDVKPGKASYAILLRKAGAEGNLAVVRSLWEQVQSRLVHNSPETRLSSLALKAQKIAMTEDAVKVERSERFELDDKLVVAFLHSLKRTAETDADLAMGIHVIEQLYGLRPPLVQKQFSEVRCRNEDLSLPVLDAILHFCGSLGQFQLGLQYYKEAEKKFPDLRPDDRLVEVREWLQTEQNKKFRQRRLEQRKKYN